MVQGDEEKQGKKSGRKAVLDIKKCQNWEAGTDTWALLGGEGRATEREEWVMGGRLQKG